MSLTCFRTFRSYCCFFSPFTVSFLSFFSSFRIRCAHSPVYRFIPSLLQNGCAILRKPRICLRRIIRIWKNTDEDRLLLYNYVCILYFSRRYSSIHLPKHYAARWVVIIFNILLPEHLRLPISSDNGDCASIRDEFMSLNWGCFIFYEIQTFSFCLFALGNTHENFTILHMYIYLYKFTWSLSGKVIVC